ncbi:MAG: hypothetical protein ABF992_01955 [Lentilactobacillus hilgardii]|nr:hypothetical protein [Lentilactobacillus hilgardii]
MKNNVFWTYVPTTFFQYSNKIGKKESADATIQPTLRDEFAD